MTEITCSMCGFRFDPEEHPACDSCPLHSACVTACCPRCGTTNINPQRSGLARLVKRLFTRKDHHANPPTETLRRR